MKRLLAFLLLAALASGQQVNTKVNGSRTILGNSSYNWAIANEGATGTSLNKIAKLTGTYTVINATTGDTTGVQGIVVAGNGTTGNAEVAFAGVAPCVFDNATTTNDYVTVSTTTAGDCHDAGATQPTTRIQIVGRVLATNGSPGTNNVWVWPAEETAIGALTGDVTTSGLAATIAANAVTAAKSAVVLTRRTCSMAFGDTSGSALTNAQLGPQKGLCLIPFAATVVEIYVRADGGTPNIIVGRSRAGAVSNLVSGALATAASGGIACSNTGGTLGIDGATTCSATLQNTGTNAGDYFEAVSGTAGGVAKLLAVHIIYTVN